MNARILATCIAFVAIAAPYARVTTASADPRTIELGLDLPLSGIEGASAIAARNAVILAIEDAKSPRVPLWRTRRALRTRRLGARQAWPRAGRPQPTGLRCGSGCARGRRTDAEIPIAKAAGLAQISMAATAIELTKGPDARKLRPFDPDRRAFFCVCASDDRQGAAAARYAISLGLRRAFAIDDNESYSRGLADVFTADFPAPGGTLLGRDHLTAFALDDTALLTNIRPMRPDVIFSGGIVSTGAQSCASRWPTPASVASPISVATGSRVRTFCPLPGRRQTAPTSR